VRTMLLGATTVALLGLSAVASAVPLTLTAHNQRAASGTLSTLKWATCSPASTTNACYSTSTVSQGGIWANANATGATAVWDWDSSTGVLSMTGIFQSTSFISSNANGTPVISDKVVDMVINTQAQTTTAASYQCVEGTFLAGVGAHGCANVSTGDDFEYSSSIAYNVGGNANCVNRTLGGDDVSTGNVRGLMSMAGGGGCDVTDGAFNLWTVVQDSGGVLIVSNGVALDAAGTNYLTFAVVPAPASVWLLGTALGLLGWKRARAKAAA